MRSPKPVILNDEINPLPWRAKAALALRALQRIEPVVKHADPGKIPEHHMALMKATLENLGRAAVAPPESRLADALPGKTAVELEKGYQQLEPGSVARVTGIAYSHAASGDFSGAISSAAHTGWDIVPKADQKRTLRAIEYANWEDFRIVRLAFEAGKLSETTAAPPEMFGPLWPDGEPEWSHLSWRRPGAPEPEPGVGLEFHPVELDAELPAELRSALDVGVMTVQLFEDDVMVGAVKLRHIFGPPPPSLGPLAVHRAAPEPALRQLAALYDRHGAGILFAADDGQPDGLWLISPSHMELERAQMFQWDCLYDLFDPESLADNNRYSEGLGFGSIPAPQCEPQDLLPFAGMLYSPDRYFVVVRGPLAGQIFFFDHETGVDFETPVAIDLPTFLRRVIEDPEGPGLEIIHGALPEQDDDLEWTEVRLAP